MEKLMSRLLAVLTATLLILLPSAGAVADRPVLLAQNNTTTEKVFSAIERRIIREVLSAAGIEDEEDEKGKGGRKAKGSKGAPPGLAKRDRLPPGLERQLQRNGRLPPGLEKRQFPTELRIQLPAPRRGTERVIIGNDAVLIDTATNIVLDIVRDVFVKRN
jgi:Ni/Co efflux regulator RcnB